MNTEEIIKQLKELRRQAGYEPNAWYEQKEEDFLRSTITSIQREERKEWIDKVTDLWKYLLMLQMKSSEANTEASTDEWNLLETIKEKIDEEFFIDYSLQSPLKEEGEEKEKIDWSIDVRYEEDPIKAFNNFIKKWCGDNYAHLIDTDEQDGQFMREKIEKLISSTDNKTK